MTAAVLPAVLVDLTNTDREKNNLSELTINPVLVEAAKLKAQDMAKNGYFAHTSPSGLTPWHWMSMVNYNFIYAGENLAVDFNESVDVEQAWLNSPKHRANIMDSRFTEIGIATVDAVFEGKPTTFVVQMFGKPVMTNKLAEVKKVALVEEKPIVVESKPVITEPTVKGESLVATPQIEVVEESKEFIAVKNVNNLAEPVISPTAVDNSLGNKEKYSKWYERLFFKSPAYTDIIYRVLIYIVLVALLLMTFIEIKRQHPKNIMYGVLLMVLIVTLSYINKAVFMPGLIF